MKRFILFSLVSLGMVLLVVSVFLMNSRVNQLNVLKCENIDRRNVKKTSKLIDDGLSTYAVVTKDIFGKSTEGGQQTNYLLDGQIKIIQQVFYSETGKSEVRYYVDKGKVFYFTKTNSEYFVPLSEDSTGKVKKVEMNEFYLDDNQKLCSWYSNDVVQENTQVAQETVAFLLSDLF